jgi:hypothetical protein
VEVAPRARRAERPRARQGDGFDVAVVDVKLPDASGVDLIRPAARGLPAGRGHARDGLRHRRHGDRRPPGGRLRVHPQVLPARGADQHRRAGDREDRSSSASARSTSAATAPSSTRRHAHRRARQAGKVTLFNPRLSALTGHPLRGGGRGAFSPRLFSTRPITRSSTSRTSPRSTGGDAVDVDVGLRDAMGAIRRVRWHLSGARNPASKRDLIYGVGIDVTERRALESAPPTPRPSTPWRPSRSASPTRSGTRSTPPCWSCTCSAAPSIKLSEPPLRDPMKRRVTHRGERDQAPGAPAHRLPGARAPARPAQASRSI